MLPYQVVKRMLFWIITDKKKLPGKEFYNYGRSISKELLVKGYFSPKLFLNPVSIVRFFEFDFSKKNLTNYLVEKKKILDISSPYLFGFYCSSFYKGDYTYINPDLNDLKIVRKYSSKLDFKMKYSTDNIDATQLPYQNESFDIVLSISVIEHVANEGDSDFIKEIWRVLKPGGIVILTFPIATKFKIEYSDTDTYSLNVNSKDSKYFFQRIYDETSINNRLLNSISDFTILDKQIFGETESGYYRMYNEKWKRYGLSETVKDPYHISKSFNYLNSFNDIRESAVIGISIRKDK